ncbi:MAG: DUF1501 domain-containing protein, partial [Planctomycetota bacterium]
QAKAVSAIKPIAPRAKRVIHLFMNGGPSQVDTFDPKPTLKRYHGQRPKGAGLRTERRTGGLLQSPFEFHRRGKSGIEVSEIFPRIGDNIDKICVLRGMYTDVPNHEPSLLMMTCGNSQPIRPSLGSWLGYGLGTENRDLPGFVVLCPGKPVVGPQLWSSSFLPGVHQGCHVQKLDPKNAFQHLENRQLSSGSQRRQLNLIQELNRRHADQRAADTALEARIESFEVAFRMQMAAQEAFDVRKESEATRKLYGNGYFSDACLTARRLVERGVRMVQVFYGGGQPWDDHGSIGKGHRSKAAGSDAPIAALLEDLESRGLLDDTLVLWGGEFGRTPVSEGGSGRDHNHHGFSVWMAGGGVKGGMTHGATDDFGFAAVEDRMHPHDLHATILHLMGIDHEKLTFRYSGRDFRLTDVHGRVLHEIIA